MSMGAVPSICKEPNVRFSEDQQEHWVEVLSRERLDHWKVLVTHENMATWRARVECKYPVADEYAVLLHSGILHCHSRCLHPYRYSRFLSEITFTNLSQTIMGLLGGGERNKVVNGCLRRV